MIAPSRISEPASKIAIHTFTRKLLADTYTPVSIYLKLRDHFGGSVLLESTDFRSKENCHSFIGLDPIASFKVQNHQITIDLPQGEQEKHSVQKGTEVVDAFHQFIQRFSTTQDSEYKGINGFFGHTGFDAVQYFDTLEFDKTKRSTDLPDINYSLYRYIIAIDHFKDELFLIENTTSSENTLSRIESLINNQSFGVYQFRCEGAETSNLTDEEFKNLVTRGKHHCQIGDVFQIVLSRRFSQKFSGG